MVYNKNTHSLFSSFCTLQYHVLILIHIVVMIHFFYNISVTVLGLHSLALLCLFPLPYKNNAVLRDIFSLFSMENMIERKGRKFVDKRREIMKKEQKDQERDGDRR